MLGVTDDLLLEEILRSPLDDMPERSFERWQMVAGAFAAVLVAGVLGFMVFGGDESATEQPGAVTTIAGSSDSIVPGSTDEGGGTTATSIVEALMPEAGGGFHEWVAIGDGEMVLFGGFIGLTNGVAPFEGTWRFDTVNGTWSVEHPAIAPSPRFAHAMAFHPPTGRVVVFGGGAPAFRPCPAIRLCPGIEDNEVWQYDPATGIWEDMTPADTESVPWPVARFGIQFAYEPVTERLITFGGVGVFGENSTPNFWNDTWAYDPATNTWEDLSDPDEADRPHHGIEYGLVWSEEAQRVLMIGGDGLSSDDPQSLYAFDPVTNTWEDLGESAPGEGPKDRWFHGMEIDPQTDRVVVFGGNGSIYRVIGGGTTRTNGNLDEVWTWTPAEGWTSMNPLEGDIVGFAADGDPETLGIVVYGGNDVWSYDGALDTWSIVWDRPGGEDEDG